MYDYITGVVTAIYPTYVVLDNQGLGFQIFVANPFRWQQQLQQTCTLYVHQVVREDAHLLYGFGTREEKNLFLKLIGVSGIGPKSALSILATDDHDGFLDAVSQANTAYLMKFPGVGKKTAAQIVLDLRDKVTVDPSVDAARLTGGRAQTQHNQIIEETRAALLGLGYAERELKKVLGQLNQTDWTSTEEALRQAFKLLLN